MKAPPPMPLWLGCNLNDRSGALDYTREWGARWIANREGTDFAWWLYTHPRIMKERAEALAPVEELLWEQDPLERGPIIDQRNSKLARINDTLSEAIVSERHDGWNPRDYPWRVLRKRQDEWDRGPLGEHGGTSQAS